MATNKLTNILEDLLNSKLRWCYKKYANKDETQLPNLFNNLSYYPKSMKDLIEKRDPNCVDELTNECLEVLKNQANSSTYSEDCMICHYYFRRNYGDRTSRSSLGQIYNNVTTSYSYNDDRYVTVKNDGWALIQKLLRVARDFNYLPTSWVDYIATLMARAKLIAGRKSEDMTKAELQLSNKMFNSVVLGMKFTLENFGEEPQVWTWDYDDEHPYLVPLSSGISYGVYDYHSEYANINSSFLAKPGNHFGVEWELDFKNRGTYCKVMRELVKADLMFSEDKESFNILPMHDSSIHGGYGVEMIFAADTLEDICNRLDKAKAIFDKYGVESSTERNHTGIHITQDWNYLKGNAFYNLSKYVLQVMPFSEYLAVTKRAPNDYCERSFEHFSWVTDGENHVLNTDRRYSRYMALNVTNIHANRLEWRMFNSCCNPSDCVRWVNKMNEEFNANNGKVS